MATSKMTLSLETEYEVFDLIETENLDSAYDLLVKTGLYDYENDYEFSAALAKACGANLNIDKNSPNYMISVRDPNAPGKVWMYEMDSWFEYDDAAFCE